MAHGRLLVFLDDDGIMEPGCLQALQVCIQETGCVAARGRVIPLTSPERGAAHYDLGKHRCRTLINTEGIAIWRKDVFSGAGGFDPLLYGHEGIELCARAWRFHGPGAFCYEPKAVLRHDYSSDPAAAVEKKMRHERNRRYILEVRPETYKIHSATQSAYGNLRSAALSQETLISPPEAEGTVSVLTTARNAAQWVEEFTRCWKTQTRTDFELIVVDDGSEDETAEKLKGLWHGDERLRLIRRQRMGRGASLNVAVQHARNDVCLIADMDDISIPSRIGMTLADFREYPDLTCLSYLAFTESNHFLAGRPHTSLITDLDVRALFGMPVSFPTFAFRKSKLTAPFNEKIMGGIDCDWIMRNIASNKGLGGKFVHRPIVYYRQHSGQITSNHAQAQYEARHRIVQFSFSRLLGDLGEEDRRFIDMLIERRSIPPNARRDMAIWIGRLIQENKRLNVFNPHAFALALSDAFEQVVRHTDQQAAQPSKPVNQTTHPSKLVDEAESLMAQRRYKEARRKLRAALRKRPDDPEIERLLLSARPWPASLLMRSATLRNLLPRQRKARRSQGAK